MMEQDPHYKSNNNKIQKKSLLWYKKEKPLKV